MELVINGERRTVPEGLTALSVLERLSVHPERVVVEVNLTILKRAQLETTQLKDGDQVEIVRLVGGGSHMSGQVAKWPSDQVKTPWPLGHWTTGPLF